MSKGRLLCADEDSNYDPDVEDRMSNSSKHMLEDSQNVDTDTSDEIVFSVRKKEKKSFCHCLAFNKC